MVLLLAVLGAVLHPLLMLLGILPVDTHALISFLNAARSLIADFMAWGLLSVLVIMGLFVLRGRLRSPHPARDATQDPPERWSAPDRPKAVAVAITAYNDAEATAEAAAAFQVQDRVVQVIVVDNNSTDDTAELARAAGATVVREPLQGYGFACIRGLTEALKVSNAEVIVLTEGDGTFVAEDLDKFKAYIGQADMVIGTRVVHGLVENGSQMDYFFTWGNIAVATLLRLRFWNSQFLGTARLSDVGCTYRAIRRDALERILPELSVGGNHFSPHMMLVALERGLSVVEIPVTFRRRVGRSKGASQSFRKGLLTGLAMIWHIMTYSPQRAARRHGPRRGAAMPGAIENRVA